VPIWSANDLDFSATEVAYRHILDNDVPAISAEWMSCFEEARHVRYKMKPDLSLRVSNTINRKELALGVRVLFRSNHDGFRTEPVSRAKAPGVYRIVLLGDSLTFGWSVNQDERFSRLLQDRLNTVAAGRRYEVINLALPGYTMYHGAQVFEHYALRYDPDMVVVAFGINDARPVPRRVKQRLFHEGWVERLHFLLRNLETYNLVRKWLLAGYDPLARVREREAETGPTEPFVTPEEYRRMLDDLIERGERQGIETVLLQFFCREPYREVHAALARARQVPLVDGMDILLRSVGPVHRGELYPDAARRYRELYGEEFLEDSPLFYVTSDTLHPNALGHRILADALLERIFGGERSGGDAARGEEADAGS
jgi:lysophospholipase L1-like esterase